MPLIKQHVLNKYNGLSTILALTLLSITLLCVRIAITKSGYLLFLVWNIFLAFIPYFITISLSKKKAINTPLLYISFIVWLLFLPNCPYIITDLFHLKRSSYSLIWLDTLVINAFAITGLLLFFYSLAEMLRIIKRKFSIKYETILICFICVLSGFGIYLGRFLRYNSWELLSNPKQLFIDVLSIVLNPETHSEAWLFSIIFGGFLMFGFIVFNSLKLNNRT